MYKKRLMEILAMLAIGDGVVQLAAPRRHMLLWEAGPEGVRRATRFFANNPNLTRLLGATEVALGVWLALRQYKD